jgi:hypothetical protein
MSIPNHPTKTRQIGVVYQNDATVITTPYELALFGLKNVVTKYAICHGENVNENGI